MSKEWISGETGVDDEWLCPFLPLWNLLPSTCGWQGGRTGLGCESSSVPCSPPKPGAACSLPAANYGQGPGPMLVRKKSSLLCVSAAVAQTWPHLEQCFLPFALMDEACALLCHCWQQIPAAVLLHSPINGFTINNFSTKMGPKVCKNPSVVPWHLNTRQRARYYGSTMWVFSVPELIDNEESLDTWTIAALMLEVQNGRERWTDRLNIKQPSKIAFNC